MSIIEEIGGILFSPRKTLESISKKEDIANAFIIVLIASILTTIPFLLPYMQVIFEMYKIEFIPIVLITIFIILLIGDLIMWAILAGICRLISMLFGGAGNYKKILQLLGYVYVMYFIFTPIYMLVMKALPILSTPIFLIGCIWYVILTAFAINTAENISLIKAFLIGIVPFILIVLWSIFVYFIIEFVAAMFLFM